MTYYIDGKPAITDRYLPCPQCGAQASHGEDGGYAWVRCAPCGEEVRQPQDAPIEELRLVWNHTAAGRDLSRGAVLEPAVHIYAFPPRVVADAQELFDESD